MIFIEYQKRLERKFKGMHAMHETCEEADATHFIAELTPAEQSKLKKKQFHRFPISEISLLKIKI
jgi:hypothetical protein